MASNAISMLYQCPYCELNFQDETIAIKHMQSHVIISSPLAEISPNMPAEAESKKWTPEMVKLLVSLQKKHEAKFSSVHWKKHQVWIVIAEEMQPFGHRVTGPMCSDKWRNLKKTYKTNKDRSSTSGEGKVTWEHFELFDTALSKRPDVIPPVVMESCEELNESFNDSGAGPSSGETPKSTKRKCPEWLNHMMSEKKKQHEEKMSLKREALKIMKRKEEQRDEFINLLKEFCKKK